MRNPGAEPCPCGTGESYAQCCAPLHRNETAAATAEQLMRSRYSAYALNQTDHLYRTWHPATRPERLPAPGEVTWVGLEVLGTGPIATEPGAPEEAWVEFRAFWRSATGSGELHEHSRFVRRGRGWVYRDGDHPA